MSKFFIHQESIKDDMAVVSGTEAHHILDVMRLKKQDKITAFDGSGRFYEGIIIDTSSKLVKIRINSVHEEFLDLDLEVTLVQSVPKKDKMEYIIEKCTELGIYSIVPVCTSRTVVKLVGDKRKQRQQRWQKIAMEAAKQCGRTTVPCIENITLFKDVFDKLKDFDLKLLFSLEGETKKINDILCLHRKARKVVFFIGPEGDFSSQEIKEALEFNCIPVSLGKNILKTDTAAISALAMINYDLIGQ